MFISKSAYEALVAKAKDGEANPKIKALTEQIEGLEKQAILKGESHEREVVNLREDHKIALERKDAQVEVIVHDKTKDLTEKLSAAEMKSNNATQKAEILETAFKNLGFDVKDMKSILNKLVDGIVSKNTIQLVK